MISALGLSQWKDERPHIDFPPEKGINLYTSLMETLKEPPSWNRASPSEVLALQATGQPAGPVLPLQKVSKAALVPPPPTQICQKTKEHLSRALQLTKHICAH